MFKKEGKYWKYLQMIFGFSSLALFIVAFVLQAVSGLPLKNGQKHAAEICRLALQLRTAANGMDIPSWGNITPCPRIGINTGTV